MNKYLSYALKSNRKFNAKKSKSDKKFDDVDNLDNDIKIGSGINHSKNSNIWKIMDDKHGSQSYSQIKSNGTSASSIAIGGGVDNLNNALNKLDFRMKKIKKPNF